MRERKRRYHKYTFGNPKQKEWRWVDLPFKTTPDGLLVPEHEYACVYCHTNWAFDPRCNLLRANLMFKIPLEEQSAYCD